MTLTEILVKYDSMKKAVRKQGRWGELDEFVEELAQLASGTPLIPADSSDEMFKEVNVKRNRARI